MVLQRLEDNPPILRFVKVIVLSLFDFARENDAGDLSRPPTGVGPYRVS